VSDVTAETGASATVGASAAAAAAAAAPAWGGGRRAPATPTSRRLWGGRRVAAAATVAAALPVAPPLAVWDWGPTTKAAGGGTPPWQTAPDGTATASRGWWPLPAEAMSTRTVRPRR